MGRNGAFWGTVSPDTFHGAITHNRLFRPF